ncbi:FtsX-like permease family protein [Kitasatospora sp. NPDC057015]|uniref:FtsX-like permease family protein n=1 Tax=Kitasatospora sp. NPDC057015 TaxID=3346001 RepID=UPI003624E327
MRATLRWICADLRSHRLPAALVVLATAGTVTALLLAGTLLDHVSGPWQKQFARANGAHVWIETGAGDAEAVRNAVGGVTGVAGPWRTATATLVARNGHPASTTRLPLGLRSAAVDQPEVSRPLLTAGRWLDPVVPDGVVLERSVAAAGWAGPGDHLTVRDAHGLPHELTVLGVADSPDRPGYPDVSPGLAWTLPAGLDLIEPRRADQGHVLGLRLADPSDADYAAQRAVTELGGGNVTRVATWLEARASHERERRLVGRLLGLSGPAALFAAALAVAGAAGGRIRSRIGDIATLKAVGFTPAGVTRLFILQHALLAAAGFVLGVAAAAVLVRLLPTAGAEPPGAPWQAVPGGAPAALAAGALCLGTVALAGAAPALRAARVVPVPPADGGPAPSRPPKPARLALLRAVPPAVLLGIRSAISRPGHAALVVARLAVPIAACTVALATWSTVDGLARAPGELTVRATDGTLPPPSGLLGLPGVAAVHLGTESEPLAPSQAATVTLRGLGTSAQPYPFKVVEGRGIRATGEAVAGQGALDLLGIRVGEWARITTDGTPRILHVVGRVTEPERAGRVVSVALDSLDPVDGSAEADRLMLMLRPGADPEQVRAGLRAAWGDRLDVRRESGPFDQAGGLYLAVVGLVALLAVITLAEVLTLSSAALRAYRHDLALLRTIGLTPRQAVGLVVTRCAMLAAAGAVLGTTVGAAVGVRLIDGQGRASGVGAGIARVPSLWSLLLTGAVVVGAAAAAVALPALRAARTPPGELLHRI